MKDDIRMNGCIFDCSMWDSSMDNKVQINVGLEEREMLSRAVCGATRSGVGVK